MIVVVREALEAFDDSLYQDTTKTGFVSITFAVTI